MSKKPVFSKTANSQCESDIHRIQQGNREYVILGTAHISNESADLVQRVLEEECPASLCVELDKRRYESLSRQDRWENLDLKEVIRTKQLSTLFVQVLLTALQKRLGQQTGVVPGTEMLLAVKCAKKSEIKVEFCDREISITLKRLWRSMSFLKKGLLISSLLGSLFDRTTISEDDLRDIRRQDILFEFLKELGKTFPSFKTTLIDERDEYLATRIKQAAGDRIVVVVGAGHVQGIIRALQNEKTKDLSRLELLPPIGLGWKWIGWILPIAVIGSFFWIGFTKGGSVAGDNAVYWGLANAIPSAIGALLAFGHPATIAAAFVAAPFASLSPIIGTAYIVAFIQAWMSPPRVIEIQNVSEEMRILPAWWKNRFLRIFLVFFLTGLGSIIGTWIGGIKIFQNLS